MLNSEEIKKHYFLTSRDEKNLKAIGEIIRPYSEKFTLDFIDYISSFSEVSLFFSTQVTAKKRRDTFEKWMELLFSGNYNNKYIAELQKIGTTHVKNEIPIHWVTASMSFKRNYFENILEREIKDTVKLSSYKKSLNKMLDINLDVLTSSYHEEEIKQMFISKRMDNALITFAERFVYGLNIVLVLALLGLSVGVIVLFAQEVLSMLALSNLEEGIISSLGTLLIIWVMIELMGTEIKYLKGDRFRIEIFVSVALVAVIRELLILSLSHESPAKFSVYLAAILVLGLVYFLITWKSPRA